MRQQVQEAGLPAPGWPYVLLRASGQGLCHWGEEHAG